MQQAQVRLELWYTDLFLVVEARLQRQEMIGRDTWRGIRIL